MAVTSKSLFYNSENGDRVYDADSFEHLLKRFFTSGVFAGCCQVTADGEGMTCSMSAGYSNCDGKIRFFDTDTSLLLQNAHAVYDRIDTVVIERNDSNREITAKVVTGAYSAQPIPTAPVRSGGIYQLVVAQIYVTAGVVKITQADITDKRPDTSVCGYVMCAVDTPDFSELYAQFQAQAEGYIIVQTEAFETWFEHMKDQLDEDAAGHLQGEIDELDSGKVDKVEGLGLVKPVVNSLTSTDTEAPLSAAQGKVLNENKVEKYSGIVDNLDSTLTPGLYGYYGGSTGCPDSSHGGKLFVSKYESGGTVITLQIAHVNESNTLYYREHASNAWTAWEKITHNSASAIDTANAACSYTYQNRPIIFQKSGGFVMCRMEGIKNFPARSNTTVCTIPQGFIPNVRYSVDRIISKTNLLSGVLSCIQLRISITTDGAVKIYNYFDETLNNENCFIDFAYPLKN